jgi:hypothetical protein
MDRTERERHPAEDSPRKKIHHVRTARRRGIFRHGADDAQAMPPAALGRMRDHTGVDGPARTRAELTEGNRRFRLERRPDFGRRGIDAAVVPLRA